MNRKRGRWEIIYDILNTMDNVKKERKTRIMYKVCLDWRNFNRYFDVLQTRGYIEESDDRPKYYEITDKGIELKNSLKHVDDLRYIDDMMENDYKKPIL